MMGLLDKAAIVLTIAATVVGIGSGQLMKTTNCTCPDDILTYNCNATGNGFTIWRGSAFDCPTVDSRILLRHTEFDTSSGTMGLCNNGAIIGHSIGVGMNNSIYMSRLMINLTASSSVIDQTVECVHRTPGGVETIIGSVIIEILTDPLPPPTNIQLVGTSSEQLIFNWTAVDSDCSTLQYSITTSNCGTCANTTERTVTSTVCSIDLSAVADNTMQCSFGIQTVVCNNISGNLSTQVDVTLKGLVLPAPTISSIIPHYNETDNKLIGMDIKFYEVETFMISNGIPDSTLSYTVSYIDSNTGGTCSSLIISSSYCKQGICVVPSINPLPCADHETVGDGDIDISISATHSLGRGPSSFKTIGRINKYVNITFESMSKLVCTFLGQQERQSTQITCDLSYGPCQQQPLTTAYGTISSPRTVTVNIDRPVTQPLCQYCYTANVSNGTFTILIEGLMRLSAEYSTEKEQGIIIGGVLVGFFTAIDIILLVVISIVACFMWRKFRSDEHKISKKIDVQSNDEADGNPPFDETTFSSSVLPSSRLPKNILPINYLWKLSPDFKNLKFHGNLEIRIKVKQETNEIVLSCAEIDITSAMIMELEGGAPIVATVNYEEVEKVCLKFDTQLEMGEKTLKIDYTGELNSQMRGFYYFKRASGHHGAATMFESSDARRALPCWDEPEFKATFDVVLTIPRDMTALSNMPEVKTEVSMKDSGNKCVTFDTTPEMSTYLLAVVVGYFDDPVEGTDKNNVHIKVYTHVGKRHLGEYALEHAMKILPFYQDYFGIPYPLPKLDIVALPVLAPFAMENWGLVTFRESRLLIDVEISPAVNMTNTSLSIGHLLAQQWFGNLVTMEWWDQLWLYEGFTNWMKYYCIDKTFPEQDIWTKFSCDVYARGMSVDSLDNSIPIEKPVNTETEEVFNSITYCKGPSIFKMLHDWIGDEDFCKGIGVFLKKFSHKNAGSEELWECISEASNQQVKAIMSTWTTNAGYPVISVEGKQVGDTRTLTVSQEKFVAERDITGLGLEPIKWQVPLTITKTNCENPIKFLLEKELDTVKIKSTESSDWILINSNRNGFYRVFYSDAMLSSLEDALKRELLTNREDRMGLQDDVFALARVGKYKTEHFLKLLLHYREEPSYTVWKSVLDNLSILEKLLSDTPSYELFKEYVIYLLTPKAKEVGWDPKDNETVFDRQLRTLLIGTLGHYGDKETIGEAQIRFSEHNSESLTLHTDLRSPVYSACLADEENPGDSIFDKLEELHNSSGTNYNEKVRIYHGLGYGRTDELISRCLKFSLSDNVRPNHTQILISSAVKAGHRARNMVWKFLMENWETLKIRYPGQNTLMQIIDIATSGFASKEKADEIEKFFRENPWEMATSVIKQNCEAIRLNASWLKRDGKHIKDWLDAFGKVHDL